MSFLNQSGLPRSGSPRAGDSVRTQIAKLRAIIGRDSRAKFRGNVAKANIVFIARARLAQLEGRLDVIEAHEAESRAKALAAKKLRDAKIAADKATAKRIAELNRIKQERLAKQKAAEKKLANQIAAQKKEEAEARRRRKRLSSLDKIKRRTALRRGRSDPFAGFEIF